MTGIREEAIQTAEATGANKDDEKSESEYAKNFAQVPYIRYPITFCKKSILMPAFFDSGNEVDTIHLTLA